MKIVNYKYVPILIILFSSILSAGIPKSKGATASGLTSAPIPVSNLRVHLRADLNVTASASLVSVWGDASGNGNNAVQSVDYYKPQLVNSSMNGWPVMHFDGSTIIPLPASGTICIQNSDYEYFVVARSASTAIQFLIGSSMVETYELHLNGASGGRFIPIGPSTTDHVFIDKGADKAYTDGLPHIFSARASASGGTVRVDGVDGNTIIRNVRSSNSAVIYLGERGYDHSYMLNGDIAEVIIYNTNLSEPDRNTVEQYLAERYGIPLGTLPVELTLFTASQNNSSVILSWNTATEVNNYGFEVEKKPAGGSGEWEKIGFVLGSGNSNSPKEYSFADKNVSGGKYLYRLKQIDNGGSYKYYDEVEISVKGLTEFKLGQNYPNPFNPVSTITYQVPKAGLVSMKVYSILGEEVANLVNEYKSEGVYSVRFDASNLASGVYIYRLQVNDLAASRRMVVEK